MKNWEEIWAKQFGSKTFFAHDFSGQPIQRDFYQKYSAPDSWDIYYIEGNECLSVNSKIFNKMPNNWESNFFIDGEEYQFVKNYKDGFNVLLLKNIEEEESVKKHKSMQDIESFNFESLNDANDEKNSSRKEPIVMKNNKEKLDPIKIWELFFDDEVIATDFAGKLINKYEYDTNHKNSWITDLYSSESNKIFIASKKVLKERRGQKTFFIDDIEYNIISKNNTYIIISSEEPEKILYSPELLCKEIENYFPDYDKKSEVIIPSTLYYSSLLINLSNFPIDELEQLRMLLQKLLIKVDIFQDIFIYSNEENEFNPKYGNNCYVRIFFKANNMVAEDIKIFNISLIIKNIVSSSMEKIREIHNLSSSTNFTIFLSTHDQNYSSISWFTNQDILMNEKIPIKPNYGELIVDKFYFEIFVNYKGYRHSFVMLKTKINDIFYLCNIDINNMKKTLKLKLI